jgi:hypothetical protein
MPSAPKKLRKQYVNSEHPVVVLRFEDGHEIVVKKGGGKTFDAYAGETIKVLAVYDKTSCTTRPRVSGSSSRVARPTNSPTPDESH